MLVSRRHFQDGLPIRPTLFCNYGVILQRVACVGLSPVGAMGPGRVPRWSAAGDAGRDEPRPSAPRKSCRGTPRAAGDKTELFRIAGDSPMVGRLQPPAPCFFSSFSCN